MTVAASARQYIDGGLVESARVSESFNPATGEVLGTFADAREDDGRRAIRAGRKAFDRTEWGADRRLRHRVLTAMADAFEARRDEFVRALARENGKVLAEAAFEVDLAIPKLRYYAALSLTESGRAAQVDPSLHVRSVAEPAGVAGVIVPWNSPVVLAVRSFAPALAAGCAVVMKLPGQTGLVNGMIHEVFASIEDLPAGVVNSVTESGSEVAGLLVASPDVDVICYTGGTRVGRTVMAAAAANLKRVTLELGGKTPMIVFADADLDAVVPTLTAAVTTFSGQFCMTGSRILVQAPIADELRRRLAESFGGVRVGPGDDPASQMGPMIDAANAVRVHEQVESAAGYASVIVGGTAPREGSAYYRPTLLEVANVDAPLVQDEVFGPVATFEVFETEAEAIDRANATRYGLAASIWSRDVDRPVRVGRRLRAGTVWTNTWAVVADQFEEGGVKQSGLGRLNGVTALAEFQEIKTYAQRLG